MKAYFLSLGCLLGAASAAPAKDPPLVYEQRFEDSGAGDVRLSGDVRVIDLQKLDRDTAGHCASLNSAEDLDGDTVRAGSVEFVIRNLKSAAGQWYRFSFRGLPARDFRVAASADLVMRAGFFAHLGTEAQDGVVKEIYPLVEKDRADLSANGDGFKDGAVAWPLYAFDFKLPFGDTDTLRLSVAFRHGQGAAPFGSFLVDDVRLERIAVPVSSAPSHPLDLSQGELVPLGGKWFYFRPKGEPNSVPRHFDSSNLDRLVYQTGSHTETPFALNRGAWLRPGFLDARGQVVTQDRFLENSVEVDFTSSNLVIHTADIPNHPTGAFPGYLGNFNHIQEKKLTFSLPLDPKPDPNARAMTYKNGNDALPHGPVGVAVNGVIFYNPFDAGYEEAVGIMDRCCGHPDPGSFYHYHKYPVCARSPFEDQGSQHSPLIGWAFDGFPVYGPYEGKGEMAMDSKTNPLNAFNIHYDAERGWHYHATPGRFPYLIGGFYGPVVRANLQGPPGLRR